MERNPGSYRNIQKEMNDFIRNRRDTGVPDPDYHHDDPGVKGKKGTIGNIKFDMKPMELEEYLNKYVVDQEEAVEILSTKICTHFNRMNLERNQPRDFKIPGDIKSNILMIGSTGVGKTYIIKLIADKLGVPFVKGDATKFSETGYVGGDVEDLVRELVHQADGNIDLAEYGIIYLDEVDKIARAGGAHGIDVSRSGVQRNLLKLMEESEVDLRVPHDMASQMEALMQAQRTGKVEKKKINTKNILFIVSGAFSDLTDIIKKRLNTVPIGFGADQREKIKENIFFLKQVETEDLIQYGFESEFIGRLPVNVVLNDLEEPSLFKILSNPNSSVVISKKRDFASYGIKVEFEEEVLRYVARRAYEEKTGARGLTSVVERITIKFEKILPSTSIKAFTFTMDVVNNPQEAIEKIMVRDSLEEFVNHFKKEHNIDLSFTDGAIDLIKKKVEERGLTYHHILSEILKDYEYGLKLIQMDSFTVEEEVINNPKGYLDQLIKQAYEAKKSSE